jgi:hypothetical protein
VASRARVVSNGGGPGGRGALVAEDGDGCHGWHYGSAYTGAWGWRLLCFFFNGAAFFPKHMR